MTTRYKTARDFPLKRDELGRALCRFCQRLVTPPRRSWCSKDCVDAFLIQASGGFRAAVFERDRGVCAGCGLDTELLRRILRHAIRSLATQGGYRWCYEKQVRQTLGLPDCDSRWEADHIIPLIEGGENSLQNGRTLCVPCHKAETRQLARRRAQRRRDEKRDLLEVARIG